MNDLYVNLTLSSLVGGSHAKDTSTCLNTANDSFFGGDDDDGAHVEACVLSNIFTISLSFPFFSLYFFSAEQEGSICCCCIFIIDFR